jgi:hypothetical protein
MTRRTGQLARRLSVLEGIEFGDPPKRVRVITVLSPEIENCLRGTLEAIHAEVDAATAERIFARLDKVWKG